jgi:hypothetical protein
LVAPNRHSPQLKIGALRNLLRSMTKGGSRSTQFVLAATLILGLTMLFVGNLVSERVQNSTLQSAAEAGALYMEAFLEPYAEELNDSAGLSAKSTEALDQLMQSPSLKRHVTSAKIWLPDGTVAYSTDKSIIHRSFPTNEIAGALKGHVVTALEDLEKEENSFERSLEVPLYEIYAPLRDPRTRGGDVRIAGSGRAERGCGPGGHALGHRFVVAALQRIGRARTGFQRQRARPQGAARG